MLSPKCLPNSFILLRSINHRRENKKGENPEKKKKKKKENFEIPFRLTPVKTVYLSGTRDVHSSPSHFPEGDVAILSALISIKQDSSRNLLKSWGVVNLRIGKARAFVGLLYRDS